MTFHFQVFVKKTTTLEMGNTPFKPADNFTLCITKETFL